MLGHLVPFLLLRREMLALLCSLYRFVRQCYLTRHRLWASAAREARWISRLLPLAAADLRMEWSPVVTMSDASLSGIAVARSEWEPRVVAQIGEVSEKARFKVAGPQEAPRAAALRWTDAGVPHRDPFSDLET
eukprot:10442513-Lingulodinium_polyedra.AAC.1